MIKGLNQCLLDKPRRGGSNAVQVGVGTESRSVLVFYCYPCFCSAFLS